MPEATPRRQLETVVYPLTSAPADYDPLLALVANARFVLLGEASHGTHEFYRERAQITQRLIQEKGFTAVAVEADWPDAYRVNRYVRGSSDDTESVEALANFTRFPTWMWRNADVLDFVGWLRDYNDRRASATMQVGFYGLDLYSLHTSISAVLGYLDKVDVSQLVELQRRAAAYAGRDGRVAPDEFFYAEQNARLVKNAEEYYRALFRGQASSWNLRDCHMAETLAALATYLQGQGPPARIVVWAHNSHLGDARATEMGQAGELNVGQLVRERYGQDAVLIGLSTYSGTVTAATEWDGPAERKRVRPALPDSYEALFHELHLGRFLVILRDGDVAIAPLCRPRLERAIGVIYRPETERLSHYFSARLPEQFDAVLHYDETRAVEPLERTAAWERGEMPETFPSGL
jgi:erythromycin esterase-like protein